MEKRKDTPARSLERFFVRSKISGDDFDRVIDRSGGNPPVLRSKLAQNPQTSSKYRQKMPFCVDKNIFVGRKRHFSPAKMFVLTENGIF